MAPAVRFWQTVDDLNGAGADRREWRSRLKDEWPTAAPYLRSSGVLAKEIDCEQPAGEGCPRKVVRLPLGDYRAVCGNHPRFCETLSLTGSEIEILQLDLPELARVLSGLFASTFEYAAGDLILIGRHSVAAGISFPVHLILTGADSETDAELFLRRQREPSAILAPTRATVGAEDIAKIERQGHLAIFLSELVGVGDDHGLEMMRPANEVLRSLRERLLAQPVAQSRAWLLPADAQWKEVRFEVVSKDVINIRFRGATRQFQPDQLGMKNKLTGKPTLDWVTLRALALANGSLGWSGSNSRARAKVVKRKQLLSEALIREFGISSDPLQWDERGRVYIARFTIFASNPNALR